MNALTAYIDGIGLLGPGLSSWTSAQAILAGAVGFEQRPTVLPAPTSLPAAERRRCGPIVKLSLAVGLEAALAAGRDPATLATVFSASGGDGNNCHEICAMLASDDRQISPTRFHNSVHNAAAGYWSIATGAMASSSVLSAYDASFGAGLLEALSQVAVEQVDTLLIACDTTYPEPLRATRPVPDEFGVALMLAPDQSERSVARISVELAGGAADQLEESALESVRASIPAARSLPMLHVIASRRSQRVVLDYLDGVTLSVVIEACR